MKRGWCGDSPGTHTATAVAFCPAIFFSMEVMSEACSEFPRCPESHLASCRSDLARSQQEISHRSVIHAGFHEKSGIGRSGTEWNQQIGISVSSQSALMRKARNVSRFMMTAAVTGKKNGSISRHRHTPRSFDSFWTSSGWQDKELRMDETFARMLQSLALTPTNPSRLITGE